MKKFNSILTLGFAALMGLAVFSSCKKDGNPPVITFTNSVDSAKVDKNASYTITGTITSEAGLDEVVYTYVTANAEKQLGAKVTSFSDSKNYLINFTDSAITEAHKIKVTATDKNGTVSASFTISLNSSVVAGQINSYTGKVLGAQSAAEGSFLGTDGTVYTGSQVQANAAVICLAYSDKGTPTLFSLPEYRVQASLTDLTNDVPTYFKASSVTAAQFDAYTDDSFTTAMTVSTSDPQSIAVANGSVYQFLYNGKKGLVKVTALTAGASGKVTVDVKIQK